MLLILTHLNWMHVVSLSFLSLTHTAQTLHSIQCYQVSARGSSHTHHGATGE